MPNEMTRAEHDLAEANVTPKIGIRVLNRIGEDNRE